MKRRIIALAVLFAFALSISLQGLTMTVASAKMVAGESHDSMAMSPMDGPMDCPSQDSVDRANCMAICAGLIGILFEPARLPVLQSHRAPGDEQAASLSDRSIIPEPHPPRPSALI